MESLLRRSSLLTGPRNISGLLFPSCVRQELAASLQNTLAQCLSSALVSGSERASLFVQLKPLPLVGCKQRKMQQLTNSGEKLRPLLECTFRGREEQGIKSVHSRWKNRGTLSYDWHCDWCSADFFFTLCFLWNNVYNRSNTCGSLLFIVPYSFFLIMQVAIIVLINTNEYLFFFIRQSLIPSNCTKKWKQMHKWCMGKYLMAASRISLEMSLCTQIFRSPSMQACYVHQPRQQYVRWLQKQFPLAYYRRKICPEY